MRCFGCHRFSLKTVCDDCKKTFLQATISKRSVDSLNVISFFGYKNIERFIVSKFDYTGYRIYKYFALNYIKPFLKSFEEGIDSDCYIIAIDENIKRGYSHTAVLAHYGATKRIKPLHSVLMAKNRVEYAGKSLQYRLNNPREFIYTGKKDIDVILIDDIITTGLTLKEAKNKLNQFNVNVLFALTIADASI